MANKVVHNLSPLDFVYNVSLPELLFPILHLTPTYPSGFGLNTNSSDLIMCLEVASIQHCTNDLKKLIVQRSICM